MRDNSFLSCFPYRIIREYHQCLQGALNSCSEEQKPYAYSKVTDVKNNYDRHCKFIQIDKFQDLMISCSDLIDLDSYRRAKLKGYATPRRRLGLCFCLHFRPKDDVGISILVQGKSLFESKMLRCLYVSVEETPLF